MSFIMRSEASANGADSFFIARNEAMIRRFRMRAKARRKTGPGLALRAEGFFRLDFLLLFYQEKSSSLAAMSGQNILFKRELVIAVRNEEYELC
jgi:hypothetical protein